MLIRLSTNFSVKGNALAWFRSYFTLRKQYICVERSKSSLRGADQVVPQASVLGPLLYLV